MIINFLHHILKIMFSPTSLRATLLIMISNFPMQSCVKYTRLMRRIRSRSIFWNNLFFAAFSLILDRRVARLMSSQTEDLWFRMVNEGVEGRVEVNQKMLIDKILTRYSSEFVVLREIIQYSDDVQSTCFAWEITCDPSASNESYRSINQSIGFMDSTESNLRSSQKPLKEFINKFFWGKSIRQLFNLWKSHD